MTDITTVKPSALSWLKMLALAVLASALSASLAAAQSSGGGDNRLHHSFYFSSFFKPGSSWSAALPLVVEQARTTSPLGFDQADPGMSASSFAYRLSWKQSHWQIALFNYEGEDAIARDVSVPAWTSFPRSYIEVPDPFRLAYQTDFYRSVLTAETKQSSSRFAFRSFYDYDLLRVNSFTPSNDKFTLTAQIGYQVEFMRYRLTNSYYDEAGAFYAKTEQRESRRVVSPLVGAKLRYKVNDLASFTGQIQLRNGALGFRKVRNDVRRTNADLYAVRDGSEQSGFGWSWDEMNYDIDLSARLGFARIGYTQSLLTTHLDERVMRGVTASIRF